MRKVLIFFIAVVLLCTAAGFIIAQCVTPQNAVIAAVNTPGSGIREDIFLAAAEKAEDITFLYKNAANDEQPDVLKELCENNNVDCIVAAAGKFTEVKKLIETAESFNLPIVLMGKRPTTAELQSYDKCRYIGGNIEYAGEMLGSLLSDFYAGGIISDNNGNYMIDTALYTNQTDTSGALADSLMRQFEYSGCIASVTEKHGAVTENDGYAACAAALSAENAGLPEAYFCTNAAAADGVISALIENGIPFTAANNSLNYESEQVNDNSEAENTEPLNETPFANNAAGFYPVVCFGYTSNTYNNILNGNLLGAVVFDEPTAAESAIQMAKNLSFYSSPMLGIEGLTIESDKAVLVPYITVTQTNLTENTWLNGTQNA